MGRSAPSWSDRLQLALLYVLPHHLLTALIHHATRLRLAPWKNFLIRTFVRRFDIDLREVTRQSLSDYPDFNAFFTRSLRHGARPVAPEPHTVAAPADGLIADIGDIEDDILLRAKDRHFSLSKLLGASPTQCAAFANGKYVSVYLAPHNYHRVHMPIAGCLRKMTYIPGRLFSVNPATTEQMEDVFARNERVVSIFDTDYGRLAMVMVGAFFVGSVEHVWSGTVMPPRRREVQTWRYHQAGADAVTLQRGQEMGRFNMGSTVIVVFASTSLRWDEEIETGASTLCGARLGRFLPGA